MLVGQCGECGVIWLQFGVGFEVVGCFGLVFGWYLVGQQQVEVVEDGLWCVILWQQVFFVEFIVFDVLVGGVDYDFQVLVDVGILFGGQFGFQFIVGFGYCGMVVFVVVCVEVGYFVVIVGYVEEVGFFWLEWVLCIEQDLCQCVVVGYLGWVGWSSGFGGGCGQCWWCGYQWGGSQGQGNG